MNVRTHLTLLALALSMATAAQAQSDADLANGATSTEWLTYGHDHAETRFSTLTQVNAANVAQLGLAWTFDTDSFDADITGGHVGDIKVKNRGVIRVSQAGDIPMIANPVGLNPEQ